MIPLVLFPSPVYIVPLELYDVLGDVDVSVGRRANLPDARGAHCYGVGQLASQLCFREEYLTGINPTPV